MGYQDDATFYLYGVGHHIDLLCLGHMVLEDYTKPTTVRHCTFDRLSDKEAAKWTVSSDISGTFVTETGKKFGMTGEFAEFGELSYEFASSRTKAVVCTKGRRIVLKNPEKFFEEKVLKNEESRKKLLLWLTTAKSSYLIKKVSFRKPKIWCLTGLYEMEDTKAYTLQSNNPSVTLGLGPAIGALGGVPIGGSTTVAMDCKITNDVYMPEAAVWAAQYTLISADYIKTDKDKVATLPNSIMLGADVTRPLGGVRDGDENPDQVEAARMEVNKPGEYPCACEDNELDDRYWKYYDEAEKRLRRSL